MRPDTTTHSTMDAIRSSELGMHADILLGLRAGRVFWVLESVIPSHPVNESFRGCRT